MNRNLSEEVVSCSNVSNLYSGYVLLLKSDKVIPTGSGVFVFSPPKYLDEYVEKINVLN
jgi:hypothetical protein